MGIGQFIPVRKDGTYVKARLTEDILYVLLEDIANSNISSPAIDQVLKYNGTNWYNGAAGVASFGPGIIFYLDDTEILAGGTQTIELETLSKTPTSGSEIDDSVIVNNNTLLIDQYMYDTGLGVSSINAGEWIFNTHSYVDDISGTTEIKISVCKIISNSDTITITGTGTSRTATITGASRFQSSDYNVDYTKTGHVITPNAIFTIIADPGVDSLTATVETLTTYTNESTVSFDIGYFLFQSSTGDINTTAVSRYQHISVQPSFTINSTDKLLVHYYATTDNVGNTTTHLLHNGTENYTRFSTPLVTLHNDQPGLNVGNYIHLSAAEKTTFDNTTILIAESFSSDIAHLTTDADAGKTFEVASFPSHAQITKIRVRADWTAGQQANTGSALVNDTGGILPTDTSITYDNAVANFATGDYAWINDECVYISADSGTVLTVTRGKKGTVTTFHDDNSTIVKANHGIRLVIFEDTNRNYAERIIELSSIMTFKGVTDDDILTTGALTGTATFTNASTAVSGSGTAFLTDVNIGSLIKLDADGTYVVVASVTDDTNLVLIDTYPDTGGAGASTRGDATHFGLTTDIQNLGHNDFLVIEDTVDEICRVQTVDHDTVSAIYDYTIAVQDALATHAVTKDVKKLMVYDLDTPYNSVTTLYCTLFVDEAISGTVNAKVEIFTDSYT